MTVIKISYSIHLQSQTINSIINKNIFQTNFNILNLVEIIK